MVLTNLSPSRIGRSPSLWALVAWTLFVWGGRVRNVMADPDLAGFGRGWRLGLAMSFVVLALATGFGLVQALRGGTDSLAVGAGLGLAAYGIMVWAIRGVDITLGDHELAFKVVHAVLATVTIALGAWAILALRGAGFSRSGAGAL